MVKFRKPITVDDYDFGFERGLWLRVACEGMLSQNFACGASATQVLIATSAMASSANACLRYFVTYSMPF